MTPPLRRAPNGFLVPIGHAGKDVSKIGVPPSQASAQTDRTQASVPPVSESQGDLRSSYSTYITKNDGKTYLLYNGDRRWAIVTLLLEDAGPVAVGDKANLGIVTSGTGILLQTGRERKFTIGKGTQLFIASTSVNRVSVSIEPIPWLEQITAVLKSLAR